MLKNESQIRAARALLNWSQTELAKRTGLSKTTIANIEGAVTPISSIRVETLEKIIEAFKGSYIEFIDEGVKLKKSNIRTLEGEDAYLRLMDEVYHTCKDHKQEVLFGYVDQSISSDAVIQAQVRMRKTGIPMKFTVKEGDTHLLYPLNEYRYIPKEDFLNVVTVIFDKYLAILHKSATPVVTIVEDSGTADVFRHQFITLWSFYSRPSKTTVERTYD